ncbi:MAG: tol-pal system protein YbgF [Deltaproteobacteria bacterium]|nr:MAG: tol-pal system protein YbgF [Deltaproteobacteria bacterium]
MKNKFIRISLMLLVFSSVAYAKSEKDLDEIKRLEDSNSKILAEATQSINALRQEVQALRGAVDEVKYFSQQDTQKNEKMIRDFDLRLTGMEERMGLMGSQLQEVVSKPTENAKKKGSESEETLYHKALAEINAQNFKTAVGIFDDFIKKFPKSDLADNAQYWKGEALFGLKDFPNAALEFQKVVQKYSKSDKVPGAVLKQGYCFFEIKEYPDARIFLQKVITEYPASDAAASAKEKLEKIEQILSGKK